MSARPLPKLCFIIPYFGKWPFWMPFFLRSCRANSSIDWLLFSDCGKPPDCPPNVRLIETAYTAYCDQVSSRLGIDFHPSNPYKLCDLKPALGYIHEQALDGYDFWGFGDLDLVYGDLRAYFTAERLGRKDVFSTHARRISGHCCLLRNTAEFRELFFQVPDWRERLSNNQHEAFDEGAFSRLFIRHKNWPVALWPLHARYRHAEFMEAYSTPNAKVAWIDGSRNFPRRWFWNHGVLTNDCDGTRVFPYVHFMIWKGNDWKQLPPESFAAYPEIAREPAWQISAEGFASSQNTPRMKILLLVQKEQRVILDRLYEGIAAHTHCDLRWLDSGEQADLRRYFRDHVDTSRYARIVLFLRFKKEIRQAAFIRGIPNLVILEHDAWQNYYPCKYRGKFSAHYRRLPAARVLCSGHQVSERLCAEGTDAVFVPKGYDQTLLRNLGRTRDIELGFVGSTKNATYLERKAMLEEIGRHEPLITVRTQSGEEYLAMLNRIRFFVSADVGMGEYMIKNFEAMACGCVLLAYSQGEAENRTLGFEDMTNIVLYRNVDELRGKLAVLRADPALADRIAAAGQNLVESTYTFARIGERIATALQPPLRAAQPPGPWESLRLRLPL